MATEPSIPTITASTAATPPAPTTQTHPPHKRKRKPRSHPRSTTLTLRAPTWHYVHLRHLPTATSPALDPVTTHLHLVQALSRFLGLHGAAVPLDILKLDGHDVWIRVPAEAREVVVAAVGGWVGSAGEGWRVVGRSSWDVRAVGREGGRDLFG
ncbi:hypothetical protein Tdes44962_MAKER07394 [Teratosphaeria destructans]|uniref:Ribonucleases P/MRP subunit Pop8-like domain-containing protein n=1 Tax=Teratosphaeria destructans TaxID=418781 RepID=A0A9W7SYW0_9PEZI|nr:hypothetical protein Tdes44962_MAKER07394 [Teratosphaeria destructans]